YAKFPIEITVLNRPPVPYIDAYRLVNVTLRVAGKKGNSVTMTLLEDNISVGQTTVTRQSGVPDEQSKTMVLKLRGNKTYQALLGYDGSNGGANPVKLIFTMDGNDDDCEDEEIEINFNSADGEYQEQIINIDSTLEELLEDNTMIIFNASESYDLDGYITDYAWDFGDGTNGTGMVVSHMYAVHGVYNVTLNITDDDYATNETVIPVELSIPTLLINQYLSVSILPSSGVNINWERLRGDWPMIDWWRPPRRFLRHYDNIWVEISTDNINWNTLSYYPGTGVKNSSGVVDNVDGWVKKEISLSSYTGQNVWVRFRMVSDSSVEYTAPCIDDVQIGECKRNGNGVVLMQENVLVNGGNVVHVVSVKNTGSSNDTFILKATHGILNKTSVTLSPDEFCLVSVQNTVSGFTGESYDIDNDGINNADEFYLPYYYGKIYAKDYFDSRNITRDASNLPVPLDVPDISNYTVLYGNNSQIKLRMNILEDDAYNINIAGIAAVNDTQESRLSNPISISLENQNWEFMIENYINTHSWRGNNETCNVAYYWNNYTFKTYLREGEYNITIGLNTTKYNASSQLILLLNHLYIEKYGINPLCNDSDNDGINDMDECIYGLSPCSVDSDNDYIMDNVEIDYWQNIHGLSFSESVKRTNNPDFDNDRLLDGFELLYNTNIINPDSDNDGLDDFDEIFEYRKVEKTEAEELILYDKNNIAYTDNGIQLKSNSNSSFNIDFDISEKADYRIKMVCSSIVKTSVTKKTNETYTQLSTNGTFAINSSDSSVAGKERERISDIVAEKLTNISLCSIYEYNTGSVEINTKIMDDYVEINDRRYYTLYRKLGKGKQTLHFGLSYSVNDSITINIDYLVVERNGLDPWINDTDNDG
ncbi:MAG: hypothetical protein COS08_05210, partial [Euryarchaeota archaeon CG01_land_8_20_14_3_00_38_12]